MGIVIFNDGDRIVNTISDRDAIPTEKRFPGMMVTVQDAIADPQTGGGYAKYEWIDNGTNPRWGLVQVDNKINVKFTNESKTISNGEVTADNIPLDGLVWQARVVDATTGVILGDIQPTVDTYTLTLGTNEHDGQLLEFSYAYGSFSAQLDSVIYELKDKHFSLTNSTIDLKEGALFSKTITENTTFAVTNVEASNIVDSFILELTNGGAFTVGWFANVEWEGGNAPTLTEAGTDIVAFFTYDNGNTWRGVLVGNDMKPVA